MNEEVEKSFIYSAENNSSSILDPKVIVDIGRGLVTLLIGISALLLSFLGFSDLHNNFSKNNYSLRGYN
ncbi:MAG: hypothetical protein OEZ38_13335 [Gammaproteobacteria bacterium]|nr:hypothetical protein [Gammaproteobacteria bacterium]